MSCDGTISLCWVGWAVAMQVTGDAGGGQGSREIPNFSQVLGKMIFFLIY